MDQRMHMLWLGAERRIDAALAIIAACALWILVVPMIVVLTKLEWSAFLSTTLVAAIPVAALCARPLKSAIEIVQAIEERDADEIERWQSSGRPPERADLLVIRQHRVHVPLLAVVAAGALVVAALSLYRWFHPITSALSLFSLGSCLASVGVACGAGVLGLSSMLGHRKVLGGLIAVGWLVPAGSMLASIAVITGRRALSAELAVRTITTATSVIFGLIGVLVSIVLLALWFAWVTILLSGRGLPRSRVLPNALRSGPIDSIVASGGQPVPQFDADDVAVIAHATKESETSRVAIVVTLIATLAIVVVAAAGYAGSLVHAALGAVVVVGVLASLKR